MFLQDSVFIGLQILFNSSEKVKRLKSSKFLALSKYVVFGALRFETFYTFNIHSFTYIKVIHSKVDRMPHDKSSVWVQMCIED